MTNLNELHALVDALPENARERARLFLAGLAQGVGRDDEADAALEVLARYGRTGDDVLAEIDGDSALRERMDASLRRTMSRADAGAWADGETFMAQMREKSRRRLAGE